jgi:transcriptional regulator with XRE-family HTH domain
MPANSAEKCRERFDRRKAIKVSRDDLAIATRVRTTTMWRWETNRSRPSVEDAKRWERELVRRERAFAGE